MFNISAPELLFLAILGAFILGPERLPEHAAQFAKLIREIRSLAKGAKQKLKDELGEEFNEQQWQKLDPRKYDPRKIIKEILEEEENNPATQTTQQHKNPLFPGEKPPFDNEAT